MTKDRSLESPIGRAVLILGLFGVVASPAGAQRAPPMPVRGSIRAIGLPSDTAFAVRITLQIDRGWYIGAQRSGSSGLPTTISWKLPGGWTISDVRWPVPLARRVGGDTLFIYEDRLDIDASLVSTRPPPPGSIRAVVSFGACRGDFCVPGQLSLDLKP